MSGEERAEDDQSEEPRDEQPEQPADVEPDLEPSDEDSEDVKGGDAWNWRKI